MMRNVLTGVVLTFFFFLQIPSFAQMMMEDIKLERIHQRKVRKYVECQIEEGKRQFSEIHPSWTKDKDLSTYRKKEMKFFLKGNLQVIWERYLCANFSKSWNGRKMSFALLLRKNPSDIYYDPNPLMDVDTGQVYYLNLRVLLGFFNLPVAFEIVTRDAEKNILEFSYLEGNKSVGVQRVKFISLGNDRTEILHTSYYKSDSHFRDKWIYPFFHRKIINEFHRNMSRLPGKT